MGHFYGQVELVAWQSGWEVHYGGGVCMDLYEVLGAFYHHLPKEENQPCAILPLVGSTVFLFTWHPGSKNSVLNLLKNGRRHASLQLSTKMQVGICHFCGNLKDNILTSVVVLLPRISSIEMENGAKFLY